MPETTFMGLLTAHFGHRYPSRPRLPPTMPNHARAHLTACARNLKRLAALHSCMETEALADAVSALADGEPDAAAEAARSAQVLRIERSMREAGA